jgi:hypothetical protein
VQPGERHGHRRPTSWPLLHDELDLIRPRLVEAKDSGSFSEMLKQAAQDAIINQEILRGREPKETWRKLMEEERSRGGGPTSKTGGAADHGPGLRRRVRHRVAQPTMDRWGLHPVPNRRIK